MHPRRLSIRARLAALYSALFMVSGAVLLTVINLTMQQQLPTQAQHAVNGLLAAPDVHVASVVPATPAQPGAAGGLPPGVEVTAIVGGSTHVALDQLLLWSALSLAALGAVTVVASWWMAGRALRPLGTITNAARRLSSHNLHHRIDVPAPRDELQELAGTLNAMLDQLQSAFESQRRFVANAAHELRTPLTVQRAAVQIGLVDPSPAELSTVREQLLETSRRSERLIDSLLLLARSDRGLEHRTAVELSDVLSAAVQQHAAAARRRDITIELHQTPATALGDPDLLAHLAGNLVDNAIKHNVDGGTVKITTRSTAVGVELIVCNTGHPVPSDQLERLVEPFQRGEPDRCGADGAGLGLAIVQSIVVAHFGTLRIDAQPRGGVTITVTLPDDPTASGP